MKKNIPQTFLLLIIIFLLVCLTTVNASNETNSMEQTEEIQQDHTQSSNTHTFTTKATKKTENSKNDTKELIKHKTEQAKRDTQTQTQLTLKFINDPNDEISTEDYLFTHMDEQYTIDINLTDENTGAPIEGQIELYQLDEQTPEHITLPSTGHIQKTYTINRTFQQMPIYAQYNGNEHYTAATSNILNIDSEEYETTLALAEIDPTLVNSTITVEGQLYYDENTPIPEAPIIIKINEQQIATATTNSNGEYTKQIKLENIEAQPNAILFVEYTSPTEKYSDAYNSTNFEIFKIDSTIIIDEIDESVVATPTAITGTVTSNNPNGYDKTLLITIKDEENNTVYTNNSVEVNQSQFTTTFTPQHAGTYMLTVEITEDGYYNTQTETMEFTTEMATLYFELEDDYQSPVLDNISLTGMLINENDDPMANVPIEISTDSQTLATVTTDANGRFNFTQYRFMSITDDENIRIYLDVEETQDHDFIHEYINYYISKRNVKITVNAEDNINKNQTLHVTGNIKDAHNSSDITQGTVKLYVNNVENQSNIALDANGNYQTDILIDDTFTGQFDLKVQYIPQNSNIYYNDTFTNKTVHIIETVNTTIEISCEDTKVDTPTNITITLTDEYNNRLNKTIRIGLTDENENQILYIENIQLTNGTAKIEFTPSYTAILLLSVDFDGDDTYQHSNNEKPISITKKNTSINITDIQQPLYVNSTITITGTVKDEDNNPLNNHNITIEIINSTSTYKTTVKSVNGQFTTTFTPTNTQNVTIRVTSEETRQYTSNNTQKTYEIHKHNTTVNINALPETIKYQDTITISGKVWETDTQNHANGSIIIKINDEQIATQTLDNGNFQITHTVTEVGNHNTLQVIFNENPAYNTSQKTINYDVTPLDTVINIDPVTNPIVNDTIIIKGTFMDENNNNLTGQLKLKVNNEETNTEITADNGKFQIEFTAGQTKYYNITISYTGDNLHYKNSTDSITFTAQKAQLKVNTTVSQDNKENTITINGTLTTDANLTTKNITINISIANNTIETTTDENGKYSITTEKLLPNEYPIKIRINQTEYFHEYEENLQTVIISKNTPKITLDEISNAIYSQEITISGQLTDQYDRPLNNTQITIQVGENTYLTRSDEEGKFSQTTDSFDAGENNITITVEETTYTNNITYQTKFTAQKQATKIILEDNPRVLPQDNFTIRGQLLDINNNKLANRQVTITVNNKKYKVKTDSKASFSQTIKKAKLGTYTIVVQFTDDNYETAQTTKTITVSKLNVNLEVDSIITYVGENMILRARLTDENNNNVSGGNIVFKINGRTLRDDNRFDTDEANVKKFNVVNGIVEYIIPADYYLTGAEYITSSYSGSYLYESAKSTESTVQVLKRNATITVATVEKAQQHEIITFTVTLNDTTPLATNTSIINENSYVIFKVNNVTVKDENNNPLKVALINNQATINYTIGVKSAIDAQNNLRNYTVTAVYVSPNYETLTNNTQFEIERIGVNINIKEVKTDGNRLQIKANLTDDKGYLVEGISKICIKVNGVTYKDENITRYYDVTDGIINIDNIIVEGIDVRSLEIVTGQRQAYYSSRITTTNIQKITS